MRVALIAPEFLPIGVVWKPTTSALFPQPAPRPRMGAMRNYNIEMMGMDRMRRWEAALKEYINTLMK
jgi:dTDP-4-dehydrorhamnose reductase